MPDALDTLIARAELTDLLAAYAHLLDWVDWDRFGDVFWPEASFDFGMFKGDFGAYRTFVAELEESYARRLHMFALPAIAVTGDEARIDAGCVILCRTDSLAPASMTISGGATCSPPSGAAASGGCPASPTSSICSIAWSGRWTTGPARRISVTGFHHATPSRITPPRYSRARRRDRTEAIRIRAMSFRQEPSWLRQPRRTARDHSNRV